VDDIMYTLECTPPTAQNEVRGLAAVRRDVFGDDFPAVVRNSAELEARVTAKFGDLFGG